MTYKRICRKCGRDWFVAASQMKWAYYECPPCASRKKHKMEVKK